MKHRARRHPLAIQGELRRIVQSGSRLSTRSTALGWLGRKGVVRASHREIGQEKRYTVKKQIDHRTRSHATATERHIEREISATE
jgi:hypothetical protein